VPNRNDGGRMKQLNLFAQNEKKDREVDSKKKEPLHYWRLFIDGASRNNPGPAGVGIVILKDDKPFEKHGFFIGSKTNNQAEYMALVIGLIIIKSMLDADDMLLVTSDSELLVKQIKGSYKVKNPDLKPLFTAAQQLLSGLNYDIGHVLRHKNKQADKLANLGIDKKIDVPAKIKETLREYEILL